MTDLYEQIAADRGSLQRLLMKVPGYQGYKEKADRREADKLLRSHLVGRIDSVWERILRIEKVILKDGGLSHMSSTREAKDKVRVYRDRLNAAAPGYSAMWAAIKIDTEELQMLYNFDELQVRFVDMLSEKVEALENAAKSGEGLEDAITAVYDTAVEADEAFKKRESVLTNLDKEL